MALRVVAFVVVGCVTLGLCLASTEAAAASGWAIQPVSAPALPNGQLSGVSCVSGRACAAVGSFVNSAGQVVTLAERWNGTSWSVQPTPPTPSLGDTTDTSLGGVSCTSAIACIAVGSSFWSASGCCSGASALVERWNGRSWSIQQAPSLAENDDLVSVSCTSAKACTTVGALTDLSTGNSVPFVERWNGLAWSSEQIPNPAGATSSSLSGVSCTSARACTAVGNFAFGTGCSGPSGPCTNLPLVERWNGTRWSIQRIPKPGGGLNGVSCTSAKACTAAGSFSNGVPLVERWNGRSWSSQRIPKPAGATSSSLSGVSCTSARACTVVGYFDVGAGCAGGSGPCTSLPLVERWNGTRWSIQRTPPAGVIGSVLTGVSCTSRSVCIAVGFYLNSVGQDVTLAERWNGTRWAVQSSANPNVTSRSTLNGVSCTSATACTAVGYFAASRGAQLALAEGWNGSTWTVQGTPSPTVGTLTGVSCTSATACVAVGSAPLVPIGKPLAEVWNGSTWTVYSPPAGGATTSGSLNGVSCVSATACTAVGFYINSAGNQMTLTEFWNGSSWSIQPTPNPAGAGRLTAVSCAAATACTAVGLYINSAGTQVTLAEFWNGTSWTIQSSPNLSPSSALNGVSCTSATACTAVGSNNSQTTTLAELWNGTSWTIQTTPNPTPGGENTLSAVSCASATACIAGGQGGLGTLAEFWNGTSWTIQTTPAAPNSTLNGVSCTSATACTAVGSFADPSGLQVALAERHS
jgi:hypothetical protein